MASNDRTDVQLSALAAGFTIGFGFLTVWEAIKQTRANRNPLRSIYIYMLWGEIFVNVAIGVIGWVFLDGVIGPTIPVLFSILFLWTFQIQLLMQIIINRIALIAEHRTTIRNIKWGTVIIITAINIAVFCIWIPAHLQPPTSEIFVKINNIWDKISKVLILIVDAWLNWYFLSTVKKRLVQQHGLTKYKPLVGFNAKLMVVSIGMDGMLIGLMFLHNQVVYIQFHPVVYMVKLNIEMSMASLVVRLARGKSTNDVYEYHSSTNNPMEPVSGNGRRNTHTLETKYQSQYQYQSQSMAANKGGFKSNGHQKMGSDEGLGGIHCRTELSVVVRQAKEEDIEGASSRSSNEVRSERMFGDEMPLGPLNKNGYKTSEAELR